MNNNVVQICVCFCTDGWKEYKFCMFEISKAQSSVCYLESISFVNVYTSIRLPEYDY
jgi:hypothetical protein